MVLLISLNGHAKSIDYAILSDFVKKYLTIG